MRLYDHPLSTCCRRVLLTAHHLDIYLDRIFVDLSKGEQNAPAFLKMNPNHHVPVLEHDGFVLWESYAIMQYLADITPGQTLYPADVRLRADINRWLFWCGQSFMPGVIILNWENAIKTLIGIGPADLTEVARGEALLLEAGKVLNDHLADREWIADAGLSLADFAIGAPLADQQRARFPLTEFSNLQRWFRQLQTLDAWKQTEGSGVPTQG